MANLTETASWEAGIYRIETTDPVIGGESGIANIAAKQLGNRTLYLKGVLDTIDVAGEVKAFAMNAAPTGFLKCNGAVISRTTYARLFTAIGTTFGAGDGSTTFQLPDLRAEFVRGWDDSRGVDSGRVFGSAQGATEVDYIQQSGGYTGAAWSDTLGTVANADSTTNPTPSNGGELTVGAPNSVVINRRKVRPRNIALLYCIRY